MSLTVSAFNPIRVTGTTASATAIHAGREAVLIKKIYWFNPTTEGHLCTLKDKNGNFIIEMYCSVATFSQWFEIDQYYDDIYCDDMDSGTLYIYIR